MLRARRGAADEQRQADVPALHFLRDEDHLVERRRDQAAQADDVRVLVDRRLQDAIAGHHHAQIDHLVAVAAQHDADDVLADVVDVALDGREHDFALAALFLRFLPSCPRASRRSSFSCSMNGCRYATAFFIARALLTTCGRNILPAPNSSPTTFMPSISGPSITSSGRGYCCRASSTSASMKSVMPWTSACDSRSWTGADRQARSCSRFVPPPLTVAANSTSRSVASAGG